MPRSAKQQSLLFEQVSSSPAQPDTGVISTGRPERQERPERHEFAGDSSRLWLCLFFQQLPLEVLSGRADAPRAVLTGRPKQNRILVCNPAAAHLGVHPGMAVNAALALAPGLNLHDREPRLEQTCLRRLANRAIRFTPVISIASCGALLLEIRSSLKLFGGPQCLAEAAVSDISARGHRVTAACAPTVLAALWLARSGRAITLLHSHQLAKGLASLPVSCLGWPEKTCRKLRRMGIGTLGECIRLPRDGLARRLGPQRLRELDQGYGKQPEVPALYRFPAYFNELLDLPAETADRGLLLQALQVLLQRLDTYLGRRQAGTRLLWVHFNHHKQVATALRVGLVAPCKDVERISGLFHIYMESLEINFQVVSVSLRADVVPGCAVSGRDLLGQRPSGNDAQSSGSPELLERLRARLGTEAVQGIGMVAGHRPELAWRIESEPEKVSAVNGVTGKAGPHPEAGRPLWLFGEPLRLASVDGEPVYQGALQFESGPERIETGWWDGGEIRRDYYIASNRHRMRLWVFRDHRDAGWYLHGLFG